MGAALFWPPQLTCSGGAAATLGGQLGCVHSLHSGVLGCHTQRGVDGTADGFPSLATRAVGERRVKATHKGGTPACWSEWVCPCDRPAGPT